MNTARIGHLWALFACQIGIGWPLWAVFVARVTIHCHGRAPGCIPSCGRFVRSGGLRLGLLRSTRSGDWELSWDCARWEPLGSVTRAESMGSVRAPTDQIDLGALNLLQHLSPVQLVPRTALTCVHISEAFWGALCRQCSPGSLRDWGWLGTGLELVTFASPFDRRPVPRCLWKRGEVTTLGLCDLRVYEGTKSWVPEGRRRGAGHGSLELQGLQA